MFLLDPVNRRSVSRARRLRKPVGGGSSRTLQSVCLPLSEASTVQALDLALPRFAGLGDGPRQVYKP